MRKFYTFSTPLVMRKFFSNTLRVIHPWTLIKIYCFTYVFTDCIAEPVVCLGPSMKPTINNSGDGDILIAESMSVRIDRLKVGDVITAKNPYEPKNLICKRLIGIQGDRIFWKNPLNGNSETTLIPKGHVWLEGDNHNESKDSRSYGAVPYALIKGRVICKVWPFSEFKLNINSSHNSKNV